MDQRKPDEASKEFSRPSQQAGAASLWTRYTLSFTDWRRERVQMSRLGSCDPDVREAEINQLVGQGDQSLPFLLRALQGRVATACGAAIALERMSQQSAIYTLLLRAYQEEWLVRCLQEARLNDLSALRCIEQSSVLRALSGSLRRAAQEREFLAALEYLTVALSALRIQALYDKQPPLSCWTQPLFFGHDSLPRLRGDALAGLAYKMTDSLRYVALKGMMTGYPEHCGTLLIHLIQNDDLSLIRTALFGFRKLHDRRALPLIEQIAFSRNHPLALEARRVIEVLEGGGADSLTLVRCASALEDEDRSCLLRSSSGHLSQDDNDNLLRPLSGH